MQISYQFTALIIIFNQLIRSVTHVLVRLVILIHAQLSTAKNKSQN